MPILRDFVLCWDEGQQQYYAFRAMTGETIYGASEEGDVTGLDRNFSAWRRPYEDQPYALNIPVYSNDPSTESWGRQRPMSDEKALELYEKHYDFETGFFFYISKQDNEAMWTKPPGVSANLPCDDLQDSSAFVLEEATDEYADQGEKMESTENEDSNEWEEFFDENRSYWINSTTGETTYENPNVKISSLALAVVPEVLAHEESISDSYYYDDTNTNYDKNDTYNDTTQYEITQYEGEENEEEVTKPVTASSAPPAPLPPNVFKKGKSVRLPEIKPPPPREFIARPPFGKDDVIVVRKRRGDKSYPGDTLVKSFDRKLTNGRLRGGKYEEMYTAQGLSRHYGRKTPYTWPEAREDSGPGGNMEGKLPWITTRPLQNKLRPLKYLDQGSLHEGPYIKRRGQGKQMVRAINRLPQQSSPADRVYQAACRGDRLFVSTADVNYEDWQLGDSMTFLDGHVAKATTLEPMTLCNAAYEDGPEAVVEMMSKFLDRQDVQMFGLMNLAKYDFEENEYGEANTGGILAMQTALQVMKAYPDNEALQGKSLMVLAQLSDNYAMRREIFKVDWVSPAVAAMNNNKENVNEMWVDHGGERGKEKVIIREPTRHAIDTCIWTAKLFGQMACDNERRAQVADDGIPLLLLAMRACREEAIVQMTAVKAIYNCVYRCESAHIMATQEDALDTVENLLTDFSSDPQLVLLAQRTIRSLQPDGWRGSADNPSAMLPKPITFELSEISR